MLLLSSLLILSISCIASDSETSISDENEHWINAVSIRIVMIKIYFFIITPFYYQHIHAFLLSSSKNTIFVLTLSTRSVFLNALYMSSLPVKSILPTITCLETSTLLT